MKKISVLGDTLCFNDGLSVSFQRTLRIPDDGRNYPLPPGLGTFPLRRVDDYADRVPEDWVGRGGVFLPMYQREAMWILLSGQHWKPRAVKVGVGKICALTGKRWSEELHRHPQDYLVAPPQPWLDGIASGHGTIRQFIAMPLGMGYTVEGQLTGEERFGGIQLKVIEPRPGRFPDEPPCSVFEAGCEKECTGMPAMDCCAAPAAPSLARRSRGGAMGLGAGGKMKQKIYPDPYGLETWDLGRTSRVFVHIVNSELWREITGERAPASPVTAASYASYGLPWFDLYDEHLPTLSPTGALAGVASVKQLDEQKCGNVLQDDEPIDVGPVKKLLVKMAKGLGVRDGNW